MELQELEKLFNNKLKPIKTNICTDVDGKQMLRVSWKANPSNYAQTVAEIKNEYYKIYDTSVKQIKPEDDSFKSKTYDSLPVAYYIVK